MASAKIRSCCAQYLIGVRTTGVLRGYGPYCLPNCRQSSTDAQQAVFTTERLDDGLIIGSLNGPANKNALSRRMLETFNSAINELKLDPNARVLILRSKVEGVFCAGADLKERRGMKLLDVKRNSDTLRETMTNLASLPIPAIAVIDGFALGGGLEMALACDIRIASPRAKLGLPETGLAIIPGAGGTQRLPRLLGTAKAKELIMTGKVLSGMEAQGIGLVGYCEEKPDEKALELARMISKKGPVAIRMAKLSIDRGSDVELSAGLVIEQQCYAQVIPTTDRIEGLNAFAEKREPLYKGE